MKTYTNRRHYYLVADDPVGYLYSPLGIMALKQGCQPIVLQPFGRLDLQGGRVLSEQLAFLVPRRYELWVIDLAEVNFMDNSGLVALVAALQSARQNGCRLVLCSLQDPVRLVLELTHLDSVFEIFDSYEDVLRKVETVMLAAA